MKAQWKDKNIQLPVLADIVRRFLEERDFTVSVRNSDAHQVVFAKPKRFLDIAEDVRVVIEGDPNDLVVKFLAGAHSRDLVFLGTVTSFFGGGYLSLKGQKSKTALEKLEHDFWAFLTSEISNMPRS
jgi:hypothetical protein